MPAGNWFGRYTRKIRTWLYSLALSWKRRRLHLVCRSSKRAKEARFRRGLCIISVECLSQSGESRLKLLYADNGGHPVFLPSLQTDRRIQVLDFRFGQYAQSFRTLSYWPLFASERIAFAVGSNRSWHRQLDGGKGDWVGLSDGRALNLDAVGSRSCRARRGRRLAAAATDDGWHRCNDRFSCLKCRPW
jgi:hypothetical protein